MDEVTHTILEQPNNMGFGGLGSGFVGVQNFAKQIKCDKISPIF